MPDMKHLTLTASGAWNFPKLVDRELLLNVLPDRLELAAAMSPAGYSSLAPRAARMRRRTSGLVSSSMPAWSAIPVLLMFSRWLASRKAALLTSPHDQAIEEVS